MTRSIARLVLICLTATLPSGVLVAANAPGKEFHAPRGLCERVARLESSKSLQSILLQPATVDEAHGLRTYSIDINNDGRRDRLEVRRSAEDAHAELEVFDASGAALDFGEWNSNSNFADLGFLEHTGRHYVVVRNRASYPQRVRESLAYVARIGPDNVVHPVCHFGMERSRSSHLPVGAAPVCQAVMEGRVHYTPFDTPFSFSPTQSQPDALLDYVPVTDRAAIVDIDNDGDRESVARVEHSIQLSHGCGYHQLAVLDPQRTALQPDALPRPGNYEGEVCADESLQPFVFEDATYIERRFNPAFPRDLHDVVQIKDGQWLTACSFDVRRRYVVASAFQVFAGDHEASLGYPRDDARDADEILELWRSLVEETDGKLADDMWKSEPGFRVALADPAQAYPILLTAIDAGRPEMVAWLLRRGVSPSVANGEESGGSSALEEAMRAESAEIVLLLLRHGADPADAVSDLVSFAEDFPAEGRRALMLAVRRLKYLPDDVIRHAAENDPRLLSELASSGLPIERGDFGWQNGIEDPVDESSWTPGDDLSASGRASVLSSLRQLKRAAVRPGSDSDVVAGYEVEGQSWVVQGSARSESDVENFLMFATSLCALHLPADCGPGTLLRKARRWFRDLDECAPESRELYGERTCRLVDYARRVEADNEMSWRSFEGRTLAVKRPLGTWQDVTLHYPAKDWP
ncbi:MAG TPA: hypothetical protein VIV63_07790 [Steroidobacteraceae bacterium]